MLPAYTSETFFFEQPHKDAKKRSRMIVMSRTANATLLTSTSHRFDSGAALQLSLSQIKYDKVLNSHDFSI